MGGSRYFSEDGPDIVPRTFSFGHRVGKLCRHLLENCKGVSHMARQLERAGTAVGALVEEAQGAESRRDFIHKMSIAHKEARESHYWIRQIHGTGVVSPARITNLTDEARQLKLILAVIVNTTRQGGETDAKGDQPDEGDEEDSTA